MKTPSDFVESLANDVIGLAIDVHRKLGPGFPESVYESALCVELDEHGYRFERQAPVDIFYKDVHVGGGLADIIVADRLVLELKAVSNLAKIHRAQLYSYLKAANLRLGLLMNFHTNVLKEGLKRVVHAPD